MSVRRRTVSATGVQPRTPLRGTGELVRKLLLPFRRHRTVVCPQSVGRHPCFNLTRCERLQTKWGVQHSVNGAISTVHSHYTVHLLVRCVVRHIVPTLRTTVDRHRFVYVSTFL